MSEESKSDSADLTNEHIQDYSDFKQEQETIAEKYAEFVSNRGPNYHPKEETQTRHYRVPYFQYRHEQQVRQWDERRARQWLEGRYPNNLQGGMVDEMDTGSFWEQLKRFLKWW